MTEQEVVKRLEYIKHSMANDFSRRDLLEEAARKRRPLTADEQFRMYKTHPVCPKCEKLAFRDKGYKAEGWSRCPSCGWHGKTVTLDEVIHERLYR